MKNGLNTENLHSKMLILTLSLFTLPCPLEKIVGEFKFKTIHKSTPQIIWRKTKKYSGISQDFFFDYFKNKTEACAIEIEEVQKYNSPIDPHTLLPNFTAPQSFCYLEA